MRNKKRKGKILISLTSVAQGGHYNFYFKKLVKQFSIEKLFHFKLIKNQYNNSSGKYSETTSLIQLLNCGDQFIWG